MQKTLFGAFQRLLETLSGVKRNFKLSGLLLLAMAGVFQQQAAFAQAGASFTCDSIFYQVRSNGTNTLLLKFATIGGTPASVYPALLGVSLNALGYNSADNFMYAIQTGTQLPSLYRLGASGAEQVATLSTPPGTPAALQLTAGFVITAGAFDKAGRYYFAGQNTNIVPPAIYRVDNIPSGTGVGNIEVSQVYQLLTPAGVPADLINFGDFSFDELTAGPSGSLFGATQNIDVRIALTPSLSGTLGTATFQTQTMVTSVGGIGSAFYESVTDKFYVYNNGAENFYEVLNYASGTPNGSLITGTPYTGAPAIAGVNATDGAGCGLSGVPPSADLSVVKTMVPTALTATGQPVTFTVVVTNSGPSPAYQVQLLEQLGAGFNLVASSVTGGAYNGALGVWSVGTMNAKTSATLILSTTVNASATTTLDFSNRVQVSQSRVSLSTTTALVDPDSTPNNKTGTWTIATEDDEAIVSGVRTVNIGISKTNGTTTLVSGSTTAYTVTLSNIGPFDASGSVLKDPVSAGLSCTATPTCTLTAGVGACPVVGAAAGQLSIANLQSSGVVIPSLKGGASMAFVIICGITATGN